MCGGFTLQNKLAIYVINQAWHPPPHRLGASRSASARQRVNSTDTVRGGLRSRLGPTTQGRIKMNQPLEGEFANPRAHSNIKTCRVVNKTAKNRSSLAVSVKIAQQLRIQNLKTLMSPKKENNSRNERTDDSRRK